MTKLTIIGLVLFFINMLIFSMANKSSPVNTAWDGELKIGSSNGDFYMALIEPED